MQKPCPGRAYIPGSETSNQHEKWSAWKARCQNAVSGKSKVGRVVCSLNKMSREGSQSKNPQGLRGAPMWTWGSKAFWGEGRVRAEMSSWVCCLHGGGHQGGQCGPREVCEGGEEGWGQACAGLGALILHSEWDEKSSFLSLLPHAGHLVPLLPFLITAHWGSVCYRELAQTCKSQGPWR